MTEVCRRGGCTAAQAAACARESAKEMEGMLRAVEVLEVAGKKDS